jgi:transposase
MKIKQKNFEGVKIYAGIDAHLKQWNVAIYIGKRLHKVFQQEAEALVLIRYLHNHFPQAAYFVGYEAGYFGFGAQRTFAQFDISCKVYNPADIPTSDKERRRKADRMDAKKIGKALIEDQLPGIFVPSVEQEADREIVRYRTITAKKETTRAKQRIKAFLVFKGRSKEITNYSKTYWSKETVRQIEALKWNCQSDKIKLSFLIQDWQHHKKQLKEIDRHIVLLSRQPKYANQVKRLRSIPGVGLLTAMVLLTEIMDMDRFDNLDKLSSYVGIVPDTASSADKQRNRGLTNRANQPLRRLLIQSAWVASARSTRFSQIYHQQLHKHQISQKAIIKVVRKLLAIIRAVWQKQEEYQNQELIQAA